MSSLKVFVLLLCCLPVFGQVVYQEWTENVPVELTQTYPWYVNYGADNALWIWQNTGLYRASSPGGKVNLVSFLQGFPSSPSAATSGTDYSNANALSPQGKSMLLSYNNSATGMLIIVQTTNGTLKNLCTVYTVDGGKGTLPKYVTSGPFSGFDGTYSVVGSTIKTVGTTSTISSTLFELGAVNSATTTCDLKTVVTVDKEILQAYKKSAGQYLVSQVTLPAMGNAWQVRVGLLTSSGVYTDLVSTASTKFPVARSCYLVQDSVTGSAMISYFGTDNNSHLLSLVGGTLNEVFNSAVFGQLTADIWINDFNGNVALLGGSNSNVSSLGQDKLVAVNVTSDTHQATVVASSDSFLAGTIGNIFYKGTSTIDSTGLIYFYSRNKGSNTNKYFKASVPGITQSSAPVVDSFTASSSAIVVGDSVTLSWSAHNVASTNPVSILGLGVEGGLGLFPASGSFTAHPAQTTTYFLTATGLNGQIAKAQVTVTATNPSVAAPFISTNGIRNAASFDLSLSPGSFGSIFGQNLAPASVPASGLASGLPYLTSLSGVQVLVNGSPVPVQFVSAGQINFLVPFNTALGNATVQVVVNGVTGNSQTVPVSATSPGLFQYVVQGVTFGIATDQNNHLITADNPYTRGQYGTLWATGLGKLDPACSPQSVETPSTGVCNAIANVSLSIDGVPAVVGYAGTTPGFPGLYQVNFQVPTDPSQVPFVAETVLGNLVAGDKQTSFNIIMSQVVQ